MPRRTIAAEDLYRLEVMTDCRLSPDGAQVVYAVQRVDRKTEKKYSRLWIVPTGGGKPKEFTRGRQVDSSPRWSPDGKTIAFLSKRGEDAQPHLYLIPLGGGEARPLTDMPGDFGEFEWTPDGKRLIVQFRRKDQDAVEREADEHRKQLGVASRHITRAWFKLDGAGFLPKERWHLWSIDARTGKGKPLTDHAVWDEWNAAISPDGKSIAFVSNRTPDPDLDPDEVDLFVMPASGGRPRQVDAPIGPKGLPSFSPDGKSIAYVGHAGKHAGAVNDDVWIVPVGGKSKARNLTRALDVHVSSWTINDTGGSPTMMPPAWSNDGRTITFQVAERGNTVLKSIDVKRGAKSAQTIIGDEGVVGAFTFDAAQKRLAYVWGERADPSQVRVRDMATGDTRTITSINSFLRTLDLGRIEEMWFKGRDGNDLQGWLLTPPGFNRKRRYPAIVEIHGGPLVQYGNWFMHEFYYLAAQGYVVAFCNPRGGRGYGEAHARAIDHAWGSKDYDDVMSFADVVAKRPTVDARRLGVTGGSYGGYMTNWIIGHTRRFKAAVTQRSVSNFISMWGSSDFNWGFQELIDNLPPWENVERYWDLSPMKYIGYARTPTLVLHNEQDLRCAIEQGEQVFVALQRLGVPSEMVRFPDEPHGLSRGGRTDRRIERLNRIRDWFDRYLK